MKIDQPMLSDDENDLAGAIGDHDDPMTGATTAASTPMKPDGRA